MSNDTGFAIQFGLTDRVYKVGELVPPEVKVRTQVVMKFANKAKAQEFVRNLTLFLETK